VLLYRQGRNLESYLLLPTLLPKTLGALVYGSLQRRVNALNGIFLHPRQNMGIKVQRDPNATMAQTLAGNLWIDAARQHMGRVRVPQVVKSDPGEGRHTAPRGEPA
jgi:hypothetical protein